jgi:hypothetical protein
MYWTVVLFGWFSAALGMIGGWWACKLTYRKEITMASRKGRVFTRPDAQKMRIAMEKAWEQRKIGSAVRVVKWSTEKPDRYRPGVQVLEVERD